MNEERQPREEFVSNLEWQIRTALSRESRFAEPVKTNPGGKMKIAILILASALVGAGGVVVKDEVQQSRAQDALLAHLQVQLRMAELQLEIARTQEDEMQRLFDAGTVEEEPLLEARAQVRRAELDFMRLLLDQEEIQRSGKEPRNEISAPLVGERDFVTERLVLLERGANNRRALVGRHLSRSQELQEAGVIQPEDLVEVTLAYEEAEKQLERVLLRLDFRQRFLSGEASAQELERGLEIAEAGNELELGELALDAAVRRLQVMEGYAESGLVGEPDVRRARLEVMRLEMEMDLIRLRLDELLRPPSGGKVAPEGP